MKKHHLLWASVAAASLVLSACGGSDDATPSNPSPSPAPGSDRIEPLDTAKSASAIKQAAPQASASSRLPANAQPVLAVALDKPVNTKMQAASKGAALQVGLARELTGSAKSAPLSSQWQWHSLADGSRVAALAFESAQAGALRLGLLVKALPDGAVLRFYSADTPSEAVEMSAADVAELREINEAAGLGGDDARTVWGAVTEGARTVLEVQLPAGADAGALDLSVPRLSHLPLNVMAALTKHESGIDESESCNLDVMCESSLSAESRAVAKMLFTKHGASYICTGTLLNDTRNSRTPYLLSAAHCFNDQASASSLVTYWFFHAAACNSSPRVSRAATYLDGGSRLLYASTSLDTILVQLNRAAPDNVVFAGSYFGNNATPGTGVIGVHHPAGDLQKYSVGRITGYANCSIATGGGCTINQNASAARMLQVSWNRGTTEQGSSGSAIFVQDDRTNARYVVGALSGGTASCDNRNGSDFYGRFNRSFADGLGGWLRR